MFMFVNQRNEQLFNCDISIEINYSNLLCDDILIKSQIYKSIRNIKIYT